MKIRKAVADDVEAVYRLTCQLEEENLPQDAFQTTFLHLLSKEEHTLFLAEEDRKVCGYLHLYVQFQLHHAAKIAEVQELVVDEQKRGQRLGRQLLLCAAQFAMKQGAVNLELTSNFSRSRAHQFYEREGFQKSSYKFVYPLEK